MNDAHQEFCASPEWRTMLEEQMLPAALRDVDLGSDVIEIGPGPGLASDVLRRHIDNLRSGAGVRSCCRPGGPPSRNRLPFGRSAVRCTASAGSAAQLWRNSGTRLNTNPVTMNASEASPSWRLAGGYRPGPSAWLSQWMSGGAGTRSARSPIPITW